MTRANLMEQRWGERLHFVDMHIYMEESNKFQKPVGAKRNHKKINLSDFAMENLGSGYLLSRVV